MEAISRNLNSIDAITLLLVLSLIMITIVRFFYRTRFANYMILPINNKYVTIYSKKGRMRSWFHFGNLLFQLLNFSVFAHLVAKAFTEKDEFQFLEVYLLFGFGLGLYLFSKMVLQLCAGFIFDIQGKILELMFNKQSYFNYSAFVACIANIFLAYIFPDSKSIIYLALALIILINISCIYSLINVNQNIIQNRFMYFILYLCALEIAPLVIFASYLKG
ncbi:DUF4271 domain-containing protein [Croceivirga thetidis]|uniref:DUF4271 domain-containing protein n=1 Tax=Croceivirga thetidis TaxID=2721623 RepID=A0ABX1GNT1_9FLAO|nr:DUF4271 domain-containing protein [Croceivirga thetidis]NKI31583.1 DUF4271 domain-containing protein [Croceivirga thetidis]